MATSPHDDLDFEIAFMYVAVRLHNRMVTQEQDRLSATFAALADPTRRAILSRLALGEASVKELAKPFHMSMPGISKHLRVLEQAGLIEHSQDAQSRPRRLKGERLKEAAGWIQEYASFWEESLDRLDSYIQELQKKRKHQERKSIKR